MAKLSTYNASFQAAAASLSTRDITLAGVISKSPLPNFEPHTNYYHALVTSIIGQQLSVAAAATIKRRFIELFAPTEFPTPEQILSKPIDELRAIGLSRPKASYILDLAAKVTEGSVRFDMLNQLSNQEIVDELIKVKGIGVWTVHMFLIFSLGRLDVLPVGDLGIRNGIMKLYGFDHVPTAEEIKTVATKHKWHPYESVASWYIWRSLNNAPTI